MDSTITELCPWSSNADYQGTRLVSSLQTNSGALCAGDAVRYPNQSYILFRVPSGVYQKGHFIQPWRHHYVKGSFCIAPGEGRPVLCTPGFYTGDNNRIYSDCRRINCSGWKTILVKGRVILTVFSKSVILLVEWQDILIFHN